MANVMKIIILSQHHISVFCTLTRSNMRKGSFWFTKEHITLNLTMWNFSQNKTVPVVQLYFSSYTVLPLAVSFYSLSGQKKVLSSAE